MKYIKNFNEKLDPNTYRRAANKLSYYSKDKKSAELNDWADKKQYGYYNVHWACDNGFILKNAIFTDPQITAIYYGDKVVNEDNLLLYSNKNKSDEKAEECVENWENGDELSITFEFGFRPIVETKKKASGNNLERLENPSKGRGFYSRNVPLFSIKLFLSDWYDGISGWDEEAIYQAELDNEEFKSSTVYDLYSGSNSESMVITKPNLVHYGIFSDRASANKFLKFLKEAVFTDLHGHHIKDRVMDILRIVGGESSDLNRILNLFNKIRVHAFYDNEIDSISRAPSARWFNNNLLNSI